MRTEQNRTLYESDEVVEKYTALTTRVRQFNNAERDFVDRFNVAGKKILVLGSGGGRVPANLLLFDNEVTGVELSQKLNQAANRTYPNEKFKSLTLLEGDATQLGNFKDNFYDVVFFPQNGIDLITPISQREKAMIEMTKKVKPGGLLAFPSHNSLAYGTYFWKYKGLINRKLLFVDYSIEEEQVVGGGCLFKGKPSYVIDRTEALTGCCFAGFTCDARNRVSRKLARSLFSAQFAFEYILYVFQKPEQA
jgi:SAM-dependent methyltransferase